MIVMVIECLLVGSATSSTKRRGLMRVCTALVVWGVYLSIFCVSIGSNVGICSEACFVLYVSYLTYYKSWLLYMRYTQGQNEEYLPSTSMY